jgi:hypothetical protein
MMAEPSVSSSALPPVGLLERELLPVPEPAGFVAGAVAVQHGAAEVAIAISQPWRHGCPALIWNGGRATDSQDWRELRFGCEIIMAARQLSGPGALVALTHYPVIRAILAAVRDEMVDLSGASSSEAVGQTRFPPSPDRRSDPPRKGEGARPGQDAPPAQAARSAVAETK